MMDERTVIVVGDGAGAEMRRLLRLLEQEHAGRVVVMHDHERALRDAGLANLPRHVPVVTAPVVLSDADRLAIEAAEAKRQRRAARRR